MIKDSEEIHKEAEQERKEKMKKILVKDTEDILKSGMKVFNDMMDSEKRKKIAKGNALKIKFPFIYKFQKFIKISLILLLFFMLINLILFNVWTFKTLISSIF